MRCCFLSAVCIGSPGARHLQPASSASLQRDRGIVFNSGVDLEMVGSDGCTNGACKRFTTMLCEAECRISSLKVQNEHMSRLLSMNRGTYHA